MTHKFFPRSALRIAQLAITLLFACVACGPKDSVEDNETPTEPVKNDTRTRLTSGQTVGGSVQSYCRVPLDLGTVVDPKRPGLMQVVLTSAIDSRCGSKSQARISIRSRQKLTLVGRFYCNSGSQLNEQICTTSAQDILSQQKTTIAVAVVAEDTLRSVDLEATAELF